MRKLSIAVLAIATAVAVASVAYATNVYKVHLGSTTVPGKGSATKPIPTGLKFGFQVEDSDSTKRATVIEEYAIGSEGLVTTPKPFPKCAFSDLDNEPSPPAKCKPALVGTGLVKNAAGPSEATPGPGGPRALSDSSPCNLQLRLYNSSSAGRNGGMILRLDGGPPIPPSFESDQVGCALPIHTAISGRFVTRRIGGVKASDFVFTVPQNLKHPLAGVDNSVRRSDNIIKLRTKMVSGKKRGYYAKVGCKGTKREVRATFKTEATASQPSQTFTARKQSKC
jgi:hypothetical protein